MKKKLFIVFAVLTAFLVVLSGCITPSICGNGLCEEGENSSNCPQDCGFPPVQGNLTVVVSDADSGEPIAFAKVVVSGECEMGKPCGFAMMNETDKMGQATFKLNTGRYTVSVSKEEYITYSEDIAIGSGELMRMDVELKKELVECIQEGEETMPPYNCCSGLTPVSDCLPDEDCPISPRYCVDCGNGTCDAHENWYNCPEDCTTTECIEEGETAAVIPGNECCPGLDSASTTTPEQDCEILVGAFVCIDCGNDICGPGENVCNCSEDCTTCSGDCTTLAAN